MLPTRLENEMAYERISWPSRRSAPSGLFIILVVGLAVNIGHQAIAWQGATTDNQKASARQDTTNQNTTSAIDPSAAAAAFAEAADVFQRDGGKLWGVDLTGPMLFVDAKSREVVANQADAEGNLKQQDKVFVGKLPEGIGIANTAVNWAGVHWAMVMWPLPETTLDRQALLAHESWHRVQEQLGFASSGADNSHLDSLQGRIWLQLEWRALATALESVEESEQRKVILDALIFRAHRRSLFEDAANAERDMEMHEGLAEYTGIRMAAEDDKMAWTKAAEVLRTRPGNLPTFVRSFAYVSGPAYGLLLDRFHEGWREQAATGDFGELLAGGVGVFEMPEDLVGEAKGRAERYEGEALIIAENKREEERLTIQKEFKEKFLDGPIVRIPFQQMRMVFNPNAITPFEEHGTVYGTITVTDVWGELAAEQGCLVAKTWRSAIVAAGDDAKPGITTGPGWKLTLKPGWEVAADPENGGSFVLVEKK